MQQKFRNPAEKLVPRVEGLLKVQDQPHLLYYEEKVSQLVVRRNSNVSAPPEKCMKLDYGFLFIYFKIMKYIT